MLALGSARRQLDATSRSQALENFASAETKSRGAAQLKLARLAVAEQKRKLAARQCLWRKRPLYCAQNVGFRISPRFLVVAKQRLISVTNRSEAFSMQFVSVSLLTPQPAGHQPHDGHGCSQNNSEGPIHDACRMMGCLPLLRRWATFCWWKRLRGNYTTMRNALSVSVGE